MEFAICANSTSFIVISSLKIFSLQQTNFCNFRFWIVQKTFQHSIVFFPTLNIHSAASASAKNSNNLGVGSVGWRPAECILLHEIQQNLPSASSSVKMGRSIDVFSVDCIIYFILSQGNHPFGEPFVRESNILANNYTLSGIDFEYQDLLQRMICKMPQQEYPLSNVPSIWYFGQLPKD